ncbi:MAG: Do family serine endopeptidase [Alphaproteobacteria bacterium]|nr:Do family serine endopeptidase [Alphaproteobacteria bacterium]
MGIGGAGIVRICAAALCAFSGAWVPASAQTPRLLAPPASAASLSFADLVERVSPAVVSVLVDREVEPGEAGGDLRDFFGFQNGDPDDGAFGGAPQPQRLEALGSGFFIDAEGHIVTNNHVVEGADDIQVRLPNGDMRKAELVGADPLTDLAVLKVEPDKNQAFVQFADDVALRVGDWVVAVGNPFGLSGTVTSGIVSAIGGEGRNGQFIDFIQIDAPINRGNSGGPTFDLEGRVVGVNTAIYSTTGGSVGIGFAIPARIAKQTVAELIDHGSVTRGWLGVSIQDMNTDLAAALGRKDTKGSLVSEVLDGAPAAKAGLQSEDLILAVNGKPIDDSRDLTRTIAALPPGATANVRVLRRGAERNIAVMLGARQEEPQRAAPPRPAKEDSLAASFGLKVGELTAAMRQQFDIPDDAVGVIVTGVRADSPADDAGLRPGVVLLEVDGAAARSGADVMRALSAAKKAGKKAVIVKCQFGSAKQFTALSFGKK